MQTLTKRIGRALGPALDAWNNFTHPGSIPVAYYVRRANVGDVLNEYLLPRIAGRRIHRVRSNRLPHLRAIGSVLGAASAKSYVWGSGMFDAEGPASPLRLDRIFALRGKLTAQTLFAGRKDIPLGDPAVLMPRFFRPEVTKRHAVGIIPHLRHRERVTRALAGSDATVLDVALSPEAFITCLLECEVVLSSSLHGLILADAYGVPNAWVRFPGPLRGVRFKFADYYSTTDSPLEEAIGVASDAELFTLVREAASRCRVKPYLDDAEALLESFPPRYRARRAQPTG